MLNTFVLALGIISIFGTVFLSIGGIVAFGLGITSRSDQRVAIKLIGVALVLSVAHLLIVKLTPYPSLVEVMMYGHLNHF